MKKFLFCLVLLSSIVSCSRLDKSIECRQAAGVSKTYGYGEFLESGKYVSHVVCSKFKISEDLEVTVLEGRRFSTIVVTAYYYVLRVEPCGSKKYGCVDVYVPEDFYNRYENGDTICQVR